MALVSSLAKGLRKTPRESLDPIGPPAPTGYAGTLPSTVAELNGWTLASIWDFAHNFKDITGSPNTVDAMPGSSSFQLTRIGSSQATVISAPQSGYADQAGITITTSSQTLYKASLNWSHSATVPTVYLCTFRFESAPVTKSPQFLGGHAGDGINGFYIQAHATSGIRASIGNGTSGFVATSYIGGTDFYDGEWHTLALCIDDAAGKVKLACGAYSTESTGLTIYAPVAIYCTVGATYDGDPAWEPAVSYLLIARGQHPLAYTNFETALDEYEDARLNNVNQTAIAGLPTAIADLNTVSGMTFDYGYNIGSNAPSPMTGSSGSALAADTGVLHSATNGTAPTTGTAPRVRTSFTSQGSAVFDSSYDNLAVPDLPESRTQSVIMLIWKAANTADTSALITRGQGTDIGWYARIDSNDSLGVRVRLSSASSTSYSVASQAIGGWVISMIKWHGSGASGAQLLHSAANGAAEQVFTTTQTLGSNSTSNSGYIGASKATNGYTTPTVHTSRTLEVALVAWKASPSPLPDAAALTAAIAATRWRYGI